MDKTLKQKLLVEIEKNVREDWDVSQYAKSVTALFNEVLDGLTVAHLKDKTEVDKKTAHAIQTITVFYDSDRSPGGSRSDYISWAVSKAFTGLKLIEISKDVYTKTKENIFRYALMPDRELAILNLEETD